LCQQWKLNAQLSEQNTKLVQHANEVTIARKRWKSITPNYYIPKATMPFQSTLVVGSYTFEMVFVLNPIITFSKLEHNLVRTTM
jgi:hypothetical protein